MVFMAWEDIHSDHSYLDTLVIPLNSTLIPNANYSNANDYAKQLSWNTIQAMNRKAGKWCYPN